MHFCDLCGAEQPLSHENEQGTKFWLLIILGNGQLRQGGSRLRW